MDPCDWSTGLADHDRGCTSSRPDSELKTPRRVACTSTRRVSVSSTGAQAKFNEYPPISAEAPSRGRGVSLTPSLQTADARRSAPCAAGQPWIICDAAAGEITEEIGEPMRAPTIGLGRTAVGSLGCAPTGHQGSVPEFLERRPLSPREPSIGCYVGRRRLISAFIAGTTSCRSPMTA